MKRIRFRVVIFAAWLVLFSNIELFVAARYIDRFTYAIALLMVLYSLILPRVIKVPLWLSLAAPIPLLLLDKALLGAFADSATVPVLFMEITLVGLTTFFGLWISQAIHDFEQSVANITIGNPDRVPQPAEGGQSIIYREVRRARNHQRPLSLLSVGVEEKSIQVVMDHMVHEAQQSIMRQYALANVSKTLCDKLEDCDIVVQHKDHFLIVLPETRPEDIPGLTRRLRKQIEEQVGVELKIGTASLPNDGYTLDGLIQKATLDMETDGELIRLAPIQPQAVK